MQEPSQVRQTVRFDPFEVDFRTGELRHNGRKITLQQQPLQILAALLERPGELVTRDELIKRLWPEGTFVDFDHSLNKAVNKLREALHDSADKPRFIETLARRGYRFVGTLGATAPAAPARIHSLAVLPLENLSHDSEQEYFADGLTEALITDLAKISALRVVSRTTAMHYKGVHRPLPEIARELGVDGIVQGTMLRSGERVRISAQLLHAPTDTHLWAESYERDLREVLSLQSEVARAIAREIQVKVTPQEQTQLARAHQVDPEAYEANLKGRYHWNKRSPESLTRGAEYFQKAIARDPAYAAAYAGLADCSGALGWWGFVSPEEGCRRGKAAALQALEMDDTIAEAHVSLAWNLLHYDFNFLAAENEFRRALELNPRNPTAVAWHAACLTAMARMDEAIPEILRAVQLDPLSAIILTTAGLILWQGREHQEAIEQCQRAFELVPKYPLARWTVAVALVQLGRPDEAVSEIEDVLRTCSGVPLFIGLLGHCYAAAGRREQAVKMLNQVLNLSTQRYVAAIWPAVIYASLNDMDQAFHWLDIAYQERAAWMVYTKVFPWFDNLRPDPRFQDLLLRMNFPG